MTTPGPLAATVAAMHMKKTVLTFGAISGAVSSVMMLGTLPLLDRIGFDKGAILGYTVIVASFLPVFFGIRAYRERAGGPLTFGRGFTVGILITLISCACYVVTWEFIYFKLRPDFWNEYTVYAVDKARASGATEQDVEKTRREMTAFKTEYDKPLVNAAYTFLEPFPIGLVVTLVSAGILRRRTA
jgi:Protein of unknown function (DUF4199)